MIIILPKNSAEALKGLDDPSMLVGLNPYIDRNVDSFSSGGVLTARPGVHRLGENPYYESDYSIVYFSLARQFEIDDSKIYIYGKFNNYELTEENEMIYNPSLETFEGILLLKQGFYNYKYVIQKNNMISKNQISGSFFQTENSYTVLVYKKGFEDLYDMLIGVGRTNSYELKY